MPRSEKEAPRFFRIGDGAKYRDQCEPAIDFVGGLGRETSKFDPAFHQVGFLAPPSFDVDARGSLALI
jgi:hypothetical protein